MLAVLLTAATINPVPNDVRPRPHAADVEAAFGTGMPDAAVRRVWRDLPADPVIEFVGTRFQKFAPGRATQFTLTWKSSGLQMWFRDDRLVSASFCNVGGVFGPPAGPDRNKTKYPGELPAGLTFDDDTAAVERKLGRPDADSYESADWPACGVPCDQLTYIYEAKGLHIIINRPKRGAGYIQSVEWKPAGQMR